jgi:hypothetical protein
LSSFPQVEKMEQQSKLLPLLCRFGWHTWSGWVDFQQKYGYFDKEAGKMIATSTEIRQASRCLRCGKRITRGI